MLAIKFKSSISDENTLKEKESIKNYVIKLN